MNRFAFLLPLSLVLVACDIHSKNSADGDDNVSIRTDQSGNVAFDLPFAKGQVKVPASFLHGGNVDLDGVKLMPGSELTNFNLDSHDNVSTVEMSFTAPASPDQVRSYFVDEFRKQGVQATVAGDTVSGKSKDGNPFTIQVGPGPKGSQGKIVAQDHDKD